MGELRVASFCFLFTFSLLKRFLSPLPPTSIYLKLVSYDVIVQELRKQLDRAKEDIKELQSRLPRSVNVGFEKCPSCSKWDVPCGHCIDISPFLDETVGGGHPFCERWCRSSRRAFKMAQTLKGGLHELRDAFRVLKDREGRIAESALRRFESRFNNAIACIPSCRCCHHAQR